MLSLHDSLSLGELDFSSSTAEEEQQRLPLLLRLLQASRPLLYTDAADADTDDDVDVDAVVQQAVERLEDRAALYSQAEHMEGIVALSPRVGHHLARCHPSLLRTRSGLDEIEHVARNPSNHRKRKKRHSKLVDLKQRAAQAAVPMDDEDGLLSSSSSSEEGEHMRVQLPASPIRETSSSSLWMAEDSQEATVTKTLSEIALLVVQSLKQDNNNSSPVVVLYDSILASADNTTSTTASSDLPSTVAALLHHTPILRHAHVAAAACQSLSAMQASQLIARLGANCPAVIPCLVQGCLLQAASQSSSSSSSATAACKASVRALAALSPREASRIRTRLVATANNNNPMMWVDVQLELTTGGLDMASLLLSLWSSSSSNNHAVIVFTEPLWWHCQTCLLKDLELSDQLPSGHVRILFLAMIVLWHSMPTSWVATSERHVVETVPHHQQWIQVLERWAVRLKKEEPATSTTTEATHVQDRLYSLVVCATGMTLSALVHQDPISIELENRIVAVLVQLLQTQSLSHQSNAFQRRFLSALCLGDVQGVIMGDTLLGMMSSRHGDKSSDGAIARLSKLGGEIRSKLSSAGLGKDEFVADPRAGLALLHDGSTIDNNDLRVAQVKELLQFMFQEEAQAMRFLRNPVTTEFIEEGTALLQQGAGEGKVPLILPLELERRSKSVAHGVETEVTPGGALFVLALYYCFVFKDLEHSDRSNPFVMNHRVLPMVAIRQLCQRLGDDVISSLLATKMIAYIDRFCPEAKRFEEERRALARSIFGRRQSTDFHLKRYQEVLRESLHNPGDDKSASRAEKAFLFARQTFAEPVLFETTVSVLMSEPCEPAPYFTFIGLCQDPLVLLRIPIAVWQTKGLRRIVLSMLSILLHANDRISKDACPRDDTCAELRDARNELVVRGLCSISDSSVLPSRVSCAMTTGLIRKLVSKNQGLMGALLKHGTSESTLDWLVEWVPETMDHAHILAFVLSSERSALTTADRLVIADGVLRIALVHGHRQPDIAKKLVFGALSQLVTSFFLVVGPVGVPVNAIVGEGTGLDATQVARKSAFRMLKALLLVQSYREDIRGECLMALQKLVGLCKGENIVSGVPGANVGRQKKLLKEILEATARAANYMGSGMQV